ncbi:MAG: hypothetical protein A3G32_08210 [Deltaproteobacteria bacterium RIFCSPLOWO2_12_FULL_40_28]|nr:MAG: hypothetical protein A3C45_00910 [Deltaproteobacteria bacterium RIFCSPHIGHO2_02_FULL_40_28]OGQ20893.1 MAG: hypothetical protein A3E27_03575 [Deltaproteobacteria bacterium RIFCSPHIGHO2_12_FULL_40_32]OGQ39294.1 MAG: hypothetical protein A3I69_04935 [Deltaproteobacteria bacterium RIFCSPLOWO2_02_FULL_40_36]OGQ54575.1 MAG: hypothetical protein A3G32_08210 [Deltaproteobacteria bacterium RIFCSPLOWO2_12_FULL_40_28]
MKVKVVSEKRERIIQAATIIFARQGFYNSTVADVAKEASVADGTIYLYFKNKDDLLISIFERSMDMFIQAAEEEINKEKSAENQLKRFIDLHLRLVHKHQELAQVIQIELRQSSKFIKEYANEKFFSYLNIVEKIIQRGKEQKIFNVDINAGILKRAIFGAIDEIALEWVLMKKKRYSIEEASYELCQMFVKGLK